MKTTKRKHVGRYEIGKKIGEGTFGKVRLGRDVFTGEKVAIKIVNYKKVKTAAERKLIEREKAALTLMNHPNIVKLYKVVDDIERGCSYMILEYVSGGELFDYIIAHGRIREKDARKFIRQMVSALEYCHGHLIVHRDLKPENLLLDENLNIKITDFGLSNIMSPGKKFSTFCGSLHYACPEILRGQEYVGPGADIWAMGVILYCLVTGSQPWNATSSEDILDQILLQGLQIPAWLSPECTDLIVKMLRLKEKDRITISEIKKHPWIMKDYDEPPPSYLPAYDGVVDVDPDIIKQLEEIGFTIGEDEITDILKGERTQIVATYHLLLRKHEEEKKKKEEEKERMLKRNSSNNLSSDIKKLSIAGLHSSTSKIKLKKKKSSKKKKDVLNVTESRMRSESVCSHYPPNLGSMVYNENDENILNDDDMIPETRERSESEPPQFYEYSSKKDRFGHEDDIIEEEEYDYVEDDSNENNNIDQERRQSFNYPSVSFISQQSDNNNKVKVPSLKLDLINPNKDTSERPLSADHKTKGSLLSKSSNNNKDIIDISNNDDKKKSKSKKKSENEKKLTSKLSFDHGKRPVFKIKDIPKLSIPKKSNHSKKPFLSPRSRKNYYRPSVSELFKNDNDDGDDDEIEDSKNSSLFGCSTTSSLPLKEMRRRIVSVMESIDGLKFKNHTPNCFKCEYNGTKFELEMVSVAKFHNLRGVKLSRVQGDIWEYKEICEKILGLLKL